MHTLALLCNLHADGPASLKRLRAAGFKTLEAVSASDHAALGDLLGVGLSVALRFRKEAELLADRVAAGLLEKEDEYTSRFSSHALPPDTFAGVVNEPLDRAGRRAGERGANGHAVHGANGTVHAGPATNGSSTNGSAGNGSSGTGFAGNGSSDEDPTVLEPRPRLLSREAAALEAVHLEGLNARRLGLLRVAGCVTLGDLLTMDTLRLTAVLGEGFSSARRLQFLARRGACVSADSVAAPLPSNGRTLQGASGPAASTESAEPQQCDRDSTPPEPEGHGEQPGTAGPFA